MYETIQKAWSCSNWQLVANTLGFPQIQSMCGAITTRAEASSRYAGKSWPQRNQEWGHIYSSKAHDGKRVDKPQQPKRRNERVNRVWPYRKDKARKSPRLQSVRDHTVSPELRHEQVGRVIGELQENRLHGCQYSTCSPSNGEPSGHVAMPKKKNFRCPAAGRSEVTLYRHGTKLNLKSHYFGYFVPPRYETPDFGGTYRPAAGHLYRLTIYTSFSGGQL